MATSSFLHPAHAARLLFSPPRAPTPTSTLSSILRRPFSFASYLVQPAELHQALGNKPPSSPSPSPSTSSSPSSSPSAPRVVPLCASWFMPNDPHGRTGMQTFREKRIPKARFFDLDAVIDRRSPYPHMLPSPKGFAAAMSELGIRREDTVVVYDSHELGMFSAPRVGWTLRVFGHPRVHLLDNFRAWVDRGFPVETGEFYSIECCQYPIPKPDEARVASFEDVKELCLGVVEGSDDNKDRGANNENVDKAAEGGRGRDGPGPAAVQVLDARSYGRWSGKDPEPREGLSSGHMPGSISLPFTDVLDPTTKTYLAAEKLREILAQKGVDPARPVIATCGTGVTACVVETALEVAGYGPPGARRVYDGSWTEWAQRASPSESSIVKSD